MRRVEFDQGSPEWLTWRRGLLTATDAPMLMGVSPYVTPFKGWQRKIGQIPEQEETEPMRRGKRDEPIAREWFIKEYGIDMEPCCVESDTYNFIGASLDGLSKCRKYLLEIKSNGDQYHFGLNGGLPEFHWMQMQHQFLSTDLLPEKGFYLSWNKSGPIVKEVNIDREWLEGYVPKARDFWKKVVFFDPPALSNKDYRDMSLESGWQSYAEQYRKVCDQITSLEEIKDSYRKELIKICGEDSGAGHGIKVIKKFVKGRIDYKEVVETMNVQFDESHFRKSPTSSWAIMLDR